MSDQTTNTTPERVRQLIGNASSADNPDAAMKFAQAALSAAHAERVLQDTAKDHHA